MLLPGSFLLQTLAILWDSLALICFRAKYPLICLWISMEASSSVKSSFVRNVFATWRKKWFKCLGLFTFYWKILSFNTWGCLLSNVSFFAPLLAKLADFWALSFQRVAKIRLRNMTLATAHFSFWAFKAASHLRTTAWKKSKMKVSF